MTNAHNFSQKVVLITGASSGLGEVIAINFAKLGAQVAITGRNLERLEKTAQKCDEVSPNSLNAFVHAADLCDQTGAKQLVESVVGKFSKLDILINNAAKFVRDSFLEPDAVEIFDKVIKTNLRSVFVLSHYAAPHLIAQKGSIVNISSANGLKPFRNSTAHCIAKAGVSMLTRALALELGPKGVRVNSVNPAQLKTPLVYEEFGMTPEQIERLWSRLGEVYPLGRAAELIEVARAVAFLASADASYVNGLQMQMDGGFLDSLNYVFDA